jgi:hypothetical protein
MREILLKTETPIFQNKFFKTKEESLKHSSGLVDIVWDANNHCFVNQSFEYINDQYDHAYNNDQSKSSSFHNHVINIVHLIQERYPKDSKIIEIGCGNGYFIQELSLAGFQDIKGYDTAYFGNDERISNIFVDDFEGIEADLIILRHTLEHIKYPKSMIRNMAKAKGRNGKPDVYIEVPDLEWILTNQSFYDIFYEHVNYFSSYSFHTIFKNAVIHKTLSEQYLSVFASLGDINECIEYDSALVLKYTTKLQYLQTKKLEVLSKLVDRNIIIWGAGAKGNILSFYLRKMNPHKQIYIIDSNASKHNLFPCGLDIKIMSFEEYSASVSQDDPTIVVMNPVYFIEIQNMVGERYNLVNITDI